MENKDYITNKNAFIMKAMGFNEVCDKICFKDGTVSYNRQGNEGEAMYQSDIKYGKDYASTVPTYYQALKWFRNKGILASIDIDYYYNSRGEFKLVDNHWKYVIVNDNKMEDMVDFKTYEEAEAKCLDRVIDIYQNKFGGVK
jgi:hypothetical protein